MQSGPRGPVARAFSSSPPSEGTAQPIGGRGRSGKVPPEAEIVAPAQVRQCDGCRSGLCTELYKLAPLAACACSYVYMRGRVVTRARSARARDFRAGRGRVLAEGVGLGTARCPSLGMLLGQVALHVKGEVVAPGEGPLADGALEGLGAGVLPVVARELVAAGEPPLALRPLALVRLLTCNSPTY
jgi:hypothetical protein